MVIQFTTLIHFYHGKWIFSIEHAENIVDDLSHVIVGDAAGPSCADALTSISQQQRDDGHVPLGLHSQIIIIVILQQVIVHSRKQQTSKWTENNQKGFCFTFLVITYLFVSHNH